MVQTESQEGRVEETAGDAGMSRLSRNGWTLSQLTEEWNYHYDERLGILCGSATPDPWMERLARQDADAAIKNLLRTQGVKITQKTENPSEPCVEELKNFH